MFPKYPFIIHLCIVQRLGVSSAPTFTRLRASVCAAKGALETISYLPLWLQPKVSPRGLRRAVLRRKLHSGISVALSRGGSAFFYPPTQGLFCVAGKKQTVATSSLLEVTSRGKYKASFWKLSHWTPCHPKNLTWIHFLTTTGGNCPFP